MPQPKAKKSVFAALACAAALAVGLLCALVSRALTAPKAIRVADYAEPVPSTFRMKADVTQADGMLLVDGYACIEGERFEHIDTFVALYSGTGGTALRLPTRRLMRRAEGLPSARWAVLPRASAKGRCPRANTVCTLPTALMGMIFWLIRAGK